MYSAVLVALDGSEAAAAAVPRAVEAAQAFALRLVLLRVVPPIIDEEIGRREQDARRAQAEVYVGSLQRSLMARGTKVEAVVESGDPAAVILKIARSLGSPLIVLTAYGRNLPRGQDNIGQVARKVLAESEAAVLLVRPRRREVS